MRLILAIILMSLAALVAFANICGCIGAYRRARRNIPGGYSNIMAVSLVFSICAWAVGRDEVGLWAFLPTLLDLGTWSLAVLPIFLIVERVRRKNPRQ